MSRRSPLPLVLAVLLVALYAVRAGQGWVRGLSYTQGRRLAAAGRYAEALPAIDRGAIGVHWAAARWLAGQVRVGLYQDGLAAGEPDDLVRELLEEAFRDYSAAIAASPASGWYWAAMGELYHQRERRLRFEHGVPLELIDQPPTALVGHPGRIAIGMTRTAIEREPNLYTFHDLLALILWEYGLRDAALEEVARSAGVQPIFYLHAYNNLGRVPNEIRDAFLEGSRAALDRTPLLGRETHLLALGRVEFHRGNHEQAERDFQEVLVSRARGIRHAEARFYLGQIRLAQGRLEEATELLSEAEQHPAFAQGAIASQAVAAERGGELERALTLRMRLRRMDPGQLVYLLEYSRLARGLERWDQAAQAARSAVRLHPQSLAARVELVRVALGRGDRPEAHHAIEELERLAELERLEGAGPAAQRLRRELEAATP